MSPNSTTVCPHSEVNDLILKVENTCVVHNELQKECSTMGVLLNWFSVEYLALFRLHHLVKGQPELLHLSPPETPSVRAGS